MQISLENANLVENATLIENVIFGRIRKFLVENGKFSRKWKILSKMENFLENANFGWKWY